MSQEAESLILSLQALADAQFPSITPENRQKVVGAWLPYFAPVVCRALEIEEERGKFREQVENAWSAFGFHPDHEGDLADEIAHCRDEGRGHFHSVTRLLDVCQELRERLKATLFLSRELALELRGHCHDRVHEEQLLEIEQQLELLPKPNERTETKSS